MVDSEPTYYRAHYQLGLSLAQKRDYEKAIQALGKAIEVKEKEKLDDLSAYTAKGWLLFLTRNYAQSEELFLKVLCDPKAKDADKVRALNNLGALHLSKGDYPGAKRYYEKAVTDHNSSLARRMLEIAKGVKDKVAKESQAAQRRVPASTKRGRPKH